MYCKNHTGSCFSVSKFSVFVYLNFFRKIFVFNRFMATEAATATDLPEFINGTPVANTIPLGIESHAEKKRNVDRGWAWLTLLSSFLIHGIVFGSMMGMGLFYSEFLDEFQRGPVSTSWLISTNCALGALLGLYNYSK